MLARGVTVMRRWILGVIVLLGAACGPALVWDRPGFTDAQFRRDDGECSREADLEKSVPTVRRWDRGGAAESIELTRQTRFAFDVYRACMEGRGYRPVTEGRSG